MIPIIGKTHDLGDGFFVTRLLPQMARRSIGPFVFFDYFGPVDFPPGKGIGRAAAPPYRAGHRHLSVRRLA